MGKAYRTVDECGRCVGVYETCLPDECKRKVKIDYRSALFATFVASLIFFHGAYAITAEYVEDAGAINTLAGTFFVSLGHGLAAFVAVAAFGAFGGYINPVSILIDGIWGKGFDGPMHAVFTTLLIWIAAIISHIFMSFHYSDATMDAIEPAFAAGVGTAEAFFFEFLGTLVLCFIATSKALAHHGKPLVIGIAVTVGMFIAFSATGGSINPVRKIGPWIGNMIINGSTSGTDIEELLVYIFAPLLGAIAAQLLNVNFITFMSLPHEEHYEEEMTYAKGY